MDQFSPEAAQAVASASPDGIEGRRIRVLGAVQGVGFRPFVFRLARELQLEGAVWNDPQGVSIEIAGCHRALASFEEKLRQSAPTAARIDGVESHRLADWFAYRGRGFEIRESRTAGARRMVLPPDLAICDDCRREMHAPADRRFRYPFINCTNCGPRYSIVEALPYDRAKTTMRLFAMCADCARESGDPADRRFHAEPIACPACGPRLALLDPTGRSVADTNESALEAAAAAIESGRIVAVKGLGGFQLLCDAADDEAVRRLRARKGREAKPLAVMVPDLASASTLCLVSDLERGWLLAASAPIVLLPRNGGGPVAPSVAPGMSRLGLMLPCTPLHLLLMERVARPIVATSGNLTDEPICVSNDEALDRLRGVADAFLVHDRGIARAVDDSVVQRVAGDRMMIVRRARGFAPEPLRVPRTGVPIIAAGAHLKSTVTVATGCEAVTSQHLGDLSTEAACRNFREASDLLTTMLDATPAIAACDLHPDYFSTRATEAANPRRLLRVQHHHAHALAVAAEHGLENETILAVAWDGTGYGIDGSIWGGEFLLVRGSTFQRAAHLRPFRLPGGEAAIHDTRRCAVGLLHEMLGNDPARWRLAAPSLHIDALELWLQLLDKRIASPVTTSAGRLFDAFAALTGVCREARFEGEAAMLLEEAAARGCNPPSYSIPLVESPPHVAWRLTSAGYAAAPGAFVNEPPACFVLDWQPMVESALRDLDRGASAGEIARGFHIALADGIATVARRLGVRRVALAGGCFLNRLLFEECAARLDAELLVPKALPPGDGAISYGQAVAAALVEHEER